MVDSEAQELTACHVNFEEILATDCIDEVSRVVGDIAVVNCEKIVDVDNEFGRSRRMRK